MSNREMVSHKLCQGLIVLSKRNKEKLHFITPLYKNFNYQEIVNVNLPLPIPTQIKMDKLIPGSVIQQLSCLRQVKYLILVVQAFTCKGS